MLSRLVLRDFKSFRDESVELAGLTVLVGTNASGKSNLLDALRFLQGIAFDMTVAEAFEGRWEGGRQTWPGVRGGLADAARKGTDRFALETRWTLAGDGLTHAIGVEIAGHPLLFSERLASEATPPYLFDTHAPALREAAGRDEGSSLRVALKRRGRGNSPVQTHSASRSLLHQLDTAPPVAPEVAEGRDRVVRALREMIFLDITPARMRGYVPLHANHLGLNGENVSALLWAICQDADARADLVDWLAELCAPELEDIDFARTDLGDVMLVLVERGGRRIPARSLSDGTLRFLGELVALRTAPEGALLLVEEIENGLHPTRVHLLVEAMETAVEERGIQVIATTHSPLVLRALSPDSLRHAVLVARPPDADGSLLRRLGDLPAFDAVAERRGVDRLLSTGWLERAV